MKKKPKIADPDDDELLPEYDLASLKGGVRGKYLDDYRSGTNVALLEPDVRAAFPTDEAVNQALRRLIARPKRTAKRKTARTG